MEYIPNSPYLSPVNDIKIYKILKYLVLFTVFYILYFTSVFKLVKQGFFTLNALLEKL